MSALIHRGSTVRPLAGLASVLPVLLLLGSAGCAPDEMLDCAYVARESKLNPSLDHQEFQPRGPCASRGPHRSIVVEGDHLGELFFSDGVAELLVNGGWYYVTPSGRTAPVLTFDNGADRFSEGLARTMRGDKIGFIDRDLVEVTPPTWDFAFPFSGGFAVVCNGCRAHTVGEHVEMRGGLWGYIDREGEAVVPIEYERDDLPLRPEAGNARSSHLGTQNKEVQEVIERNRSAVRAQLARLLFGDRQTALWVCDANADRVERTTRKPGAGVGEMIASFNALYREEGDPQLVLQAVEGDTTVIAVAQARALTQSMGTTGAQCFLAGATFSVTSLPGVDYVWFQFEEGDHAAPGRYSRAHFPYLWPLSPDVDGRSVKP